MAMYIVIVSLFYYSVHNRIDRVFIYKTDLTNVDPINCFCTYPTHGLHPPSVAEVTQYDLEYSTSRKITRFFGVESVSWTRKDVMVAYLDIGKSPNEIIQKIAASGSDEYFFSLDGEAYGVFIKENLYQLNLSVELTNDENYRTVALLNSIFENFLSDFNGLLVEKEPQVFSKRFVNGLLLSVVYI
jgi:hypothetical protein